MQVINARIEIARLSDAAEIGHLSRDEIEHGLGWKYTARKIRLLIRNKSKNVAVARTANDLAGFGIMTYRRDQANLDLLAVKPKYRRNRIASEIILWLEKVAVTAGVYNVFVQLRVNNIAALTLYEKLGYQKLEKLPGLYRGLEDGFLMAKTLRTMINAT